MLKMKNMHLRVGTKPGNAKLTVQDESCEFILVNPMDSIYNNQARKYLPRVADLQDRVAH